MIGKPQNREQRKDRDRRARQILYQAEDAKKDKLKYFFDAGTY